MSDGFQPTWSKYVASKNIKAGIRVDIWPSMTFLREPQAVMCLGANLVQI